MKAGFPCNLMKIEFTQVFSDNIELPMVALFNDTVISESDVRAWLNRGLFDIDAHKAIVVITKTQYDNLFDRASEDFYGELRLEQHGGII